MSEQVVLVLGYGGRVGADVAKDFASTGYKVAVVSRSKKLYDPTLGYLWIQADLTDPSTVENIFSQVVNELGHPSVVVYNATGLTMTASSTLLEQFSAFQADNNVNLVSAYGAAHFAIKSFQQLPQSSLKTFIYTGNKLPFMIVQPLLSQGVGKAGAAHLIHYLAEQHKHEGYRFYFADERKMDGDPVYQGIDGVAHAQFYMHLSSEKSQGPWNATFVKGRGYVKFPEDVIHEAVRLPGIADEAEE